MQTPRLGVAVSDRSGVQNAEQHTALAYAPEAARASVHVRAEPSVFSARALRVDVRVRNEADGLSIMHSLGGGVLR